MRASILSLVGGLIACCLATQAVAQTNDGEATLKRWYPEANRIRLEPANRSMQSIYVKDAKVLGVLIGVVRNMA